MKSSGSACSDPPQDTALCHPCVGQTSDSGTSLFVCAWFPVPPPMQSVAEREEEAERAAHRFKVGRLLGVAAACAQQVAACVQHLPSGAEHTLRG